MSRHRIDPKAGYVSTSKLPRGPGGRALCRQCEREVPPGRRSYCSDLCVHEWKIKSNPGYVRLLVQERDHGICAVCAGDTQLVKRSLEDLRRYWLWLARCHFEQHHPAEYKGAAWHPYYSFSLATEAVEQDLKPYGDRARWQADHILPVVEGGGGCGLEGYRTLCGRCHKAVTKALHGRLKEIRRAATRNLVGP